MDGFPSRRDVMSKRSVENFDKFHFGHNRKQNVR